MADDAPVCNVCQEPVPALVVLSSCRHAFCIPCLRQWSVSGAHVIPDDGLGARLSTRDPTCPLCREPFHFSICFAEREIQTAALDVYEPRKMNRQATCSRCKREFVTRELKPKCPGCRRDVQVDRRLDVECPGCQQRVETSKLFDHAMACVKVPCPACQQQYADFATHVQEECPSVPVTCCAFTGTFARTQEHVRRRGPFGCGSLFSF